MATDVAQGITKEAVHTLLVRQGEPEWLTDWRRQAWETFESVPWPDATQETWKRMSRKRLDLEEYRLWVAAGKTQPEAPLPPEWAEWLQKAGGVVHQYNSEGAGCYLAEDLRRAGVIFTPLDEAARRWPHLVSTHLGRAVPPVMGKFEALQGALWSGGAFLYVPPNVQVGSPLLVHTYVEALNAAFFPRVLVVAEAGGAVTLFEVHESHPRQEEGFVSPVAEVIVGAQAQVNYVTIQQWDGSMREIGTRHALLGPSARLDWTTIALGARLSHMRLQATLEGEGARAVVRALYLPRDNEEVHFHTLQDHRAAHTTSHLLFQGALRDAARAVYHGVIRVHPEAQQTESYQQNRNLLLSDGARADTLPVLEIEANDVRCSHAATVGQVDPDQLFYLMTRGLPRSEAEQMLVQGFFQNILKAVPDEGVRDQVAAQVAKKARG